MIEVQRGTTAFRPRVRGIGPWPIVLSWMATMLGGYIYIVDDDRAVRASLLALFEANGYTSHIFSSAQEFLAAAASLHTSCLIADIRMPGMDGLEMQQRLID